MTGQCPNCDAALVGRRTCPACEPAPVGRRAEDGRSWFHTAVVILALVLAIVVCGLLGKCAGFWLADVRTNVAAMEVAVCERDALAAGRSSAECAP